MKYLFYILPHCLIFLYIHPIQARVWYVKADAVGANTGLNWADAFRDLQDGLRAAEAGDEIWVAQGVYVPTKTGDRGISFEMKSGIGLYGGFGGWETLREQRNRELNGTTLSGKIGAGQNAYHVLTGRNVSDVEIDGFFIIEGIANTPRGMGHDDGGAMHLQSLGKNIICNIKISHCLIQGNMATDSGGGIFLRTYGGGKFNLNILSCGFWGNKAAEGGAIAAITENGSLNIAIEGCIFSDNQSKIEDTHLDSGGAILIFSTFSQNDQISIRNSSFIGNSAQMHGGAIALHRHRRNGFVAEIINCDFNNNKSKGVGGAVYINLEAADNIEKLAVFDIAHCRFTNNEAGGMGGAICYAMQPQTGAMTCLQHCLFAQNRVVSNPVSMQTNWLKNREAPLAAGGGVAAVFQNDLDSLSSFRLYDCQFEENASTGIAGACYIEGTQDKVAPISFFDVLFDKNTAVDGTAIFHNTLGQPLHLVGCKVPSEKGAISGTKEYVIEKQPDTDNPPQKMRGKWVTDENGNRVFIAHRY